MENLTDITEFSHIYMTFTVENKPDIEFVQGTDKGKVFVPESVQVLYRWSHDKDKDPQGPVWEATVFGHRRLKNGTFGIELFLSYEPWKQIDVERPEWLIDLVKAYGPEGWTYGSHW